MRFLICILFFLCSCSSENGAIESETKLIEKEQEVSNLKENIVSFETVVGESFDERKRDYYYKIYGGGIPGKMVEIFQAGLVGSRIASIAHAGASSFPNKRGEEIARICFERYSDSIFNATGCVAAQVHFWVEEQDFDWSSLGIDGFRTYCMTYARAVLISMERIIKLNPHWEGVVKIGYSNTPYHILNKLSVKTTIGKWYEYAFDTGHDYDRAKFPLYPHNSNSVEFHIGGKALTEVSIAKSK